MFMRVQSTKFICRCMHLDMFFIEILKIKPNSEPCATPLSLLLRQEPPGQETPALPQGLYGQEPSRWEATGPKNKPLPPLPPDRERRRKNISNPFFHFLKKDLGPPKNAFQKHRKHSNITACWVYPGKKNQNSKAISPAGARNGEWTRTL